MSDAADHAAAPRAGPAPWPSPPAPGPLHGRTVLVTGASRGLGACIAAVLGEAGARIVVADLAFERANEQVAQLRGRGIEAHAMALDVADEAQVRHVVSDARERLGPLFALVNNAAIDVALPLEQLSANDWSRVLETNLSGPFLMAKYAVAAMAPAAAPGATAGHIVNIASTASKRAWPNAAAYHATQWGLLGLSHALHAELRPRGIKVCAVVAGGMRTPFLLDRFPDIDPGALQGPMNVARTVLFVLTQPAETVIPELMVLPMRETSWP